MRADNGARVETIAQAILDHLRLHPLAADSVTGVARWWLKPAQSGASLQQVQRALTLLVARSVVRELKLTDGTTLYSQAPPDRQ